FHAAAGTNYAIQVDGHYGITGNIVLSWNLEVTSNQLPAIVTQPLSQTAAVGTDVTLSVTVQTNPAIVYQWFKNDVPIASATNSTLTLTDLSAYQVGVYQVQVSNSIALGSIFSR